MWHLIIAGFFTNPQALLLPDKSRQVTHVELRLLWQVLGSELLIIIIVIIDFVFEAVDRLEVADLDGKFLDYSGGHCHSCPDVHGSLVELQVDLLHFVADPLVVADLLHLLLCFTPKLCSEVTVLDLQVLGQYSDISELEEEILDPSLGLGCDGVFPVVDDKLNLLVEEHFFDEFTGVDDQFARMQVFECFLIALWAI